MHMCGIEGYSLVKNHNQDIVSQQHILLMYHSGTFAFSSYLQVFYAASALSKNED